MTAALEVPADPETVDGWTGPAPRGTAVVVMPRTMTRPLLMLMVSEAVSMWDRLRLNGRSPQCKTDR